MTEAVRLRGKPAPLTHNFLALTYLALGQKDRAAAARAQAQPANNAPWEELLLQRLMQPEIEAAFAAAAIPSQRRKDAKMTLGWRLCGFARDFRRTP